jgi:hypothetical protein
MIDDWPNINRRTGINLALRQLKNRVNLTRAPLDIYLEQKRKGRVDRRPG